MSYLENTPFYEIAFDSSNGAQLSEKALKNRKRLILLWKIKSAECKALELDIKNIEHETEDALAGHPFAELLRDLFLAGQNGVVFPILKMEKLEKISNLVLLKD